jgi:hypothetical protein
VATEVKGGGGVTRFFVVLLAVAGLGYGVTRAAAADDAGRLPEGRSQQPAVVAASPSAQPAAVPPAQVVLPAPDPLTPDTSLFSEGDRGPKVRALQARLRQLGWYAGNVSGRYTPRTTRAVQGFQTRHTLPATGSVDRPTMQQLRTITRKPTRDELLNRTVGGQGGGGTWTLAPLDKRCLTGHVLCVDKTTRTIRWVVDGEVHKTMAVRFGAAYTPTREGVFHIGWKSRDHVSTLFHTSMPFAMFFSGGQAVHYSSDFAARGYAGASHGCVNVRDYEGIRWLFDQVRVGDKVVISWS